MLNKFHIARWHSQGKSTLEDFILPHNAKFISFSRLVNILLIYVSKYLKQLNKIKQRLILVLSDSESDLGKDAILELVMNRPAKIIYLTDFWQNFDYWRDDSKYDLASKSIKYSHLTDEIVKANPIIVHYRLGQIKNKWEHAWGALGPQYISDALNHLERVSGLNNHQIWIFSNDLNHAKYLVNNYKFRTNYSFEFIDDAGMSPAEVIKLFSECNFFVCSNSTFSLAAAKIGNASNVIVPSELAQSRIINMVLPNSWVKIKSSWL